jgi:hypothetical protein
MEKDVSETRPTVVLAHGGSGRVTDVGSTA